MSSAVLRRKRNKLWWFGQKKRDACGNNKAKKPCRRERLYNTGHVPHSFHYWPPQSEITTACLAYGSFSQYRRNDPPGQPMAEVLCVCRPSTLIVLSIRAPILPGKQENTSREIQEELHFSWEIGKVIYIQICALVRLAQRPARYSIVRTKKVLHMEHISKEGKRLLAAKHKETNTKNVISISYSLNSCH